MARVPELMPFFAPTINSYKRYQDGSWAPTRIAWSYDNRTAGFRVVGHGPTLRIECRIPGADCNPYLAYAAILAAGLDGIANETEPPDLFSGDVYQARELPRVPYTLRDATDLFESSEFVRASFGEDVQEHYTHFFRKEQRASTTPSPTGNAGDTSRGSERSAWREGGTDHRGRFRDRPRGRASLRRRRGVGGRRRPQPRGARRDRPGRHRRRRRPRHTVRPTSPRPRTARRW